MEAAVARRRFAEALTTACAGTLLADDFASCGAGGCNHGEADEVG
jgi:hypothetical protein